MFFQRLRFFHLTFYWFFSIFIFYDGSYLTLSKKIRGHDYQHQQSKWSRHDERNDGRMKSVFCQAWPLENDQVIQKLKFHGVFIQIKDVLYSYRSITRVSFFSLNFQFIEFLLWNKNRHKVSPSRDSEGDWRILLTFPLVDALYSLPLHDSLCRTPPSNPAQPKPTNQPDILLLIQFVKAVLLKITE
jgi:hypothetical protein